jgi:D-alanyl-lipoteichoic acid acyltransferase DltB (MBOAT superfamily)
MAVGLARMFGFELPVNFYSPYKASSIIDFWRRWHITLSRFLRDYLYIPLGGNRRGPLRRYLNLAVVMLLGGLWHGANWTFVIWGGVHGLMLAVNHGWRALPLSRCLALKTRLAEGGRRRRRCRWKRCAGREAHLGACRASPSGG